VKNQQIKKKANKQTINKKKQSSCKDATKGGNTTPAILTSSPFSFALLKGATSQYFHSFF